MTFPTRILTLALLTGAFSTTLASTANAQTCNHSLNATYEVTFDASWSFQNHPTDFPGNPHFSPLIGGTHLSNFSLWEMGSLASPGMESMAELGATSLLTQEINSAIANNDMEFLLSGGGINSPGSISFTFDLTSDYPAVTLVTMIAPSPDWFIGVDGLELFQNDRWMDQIVVNLNAYDAGTDDGIQYTSGNANSNPAQPIAQIAGYPFAGVPLGTFTFTKVESEDLGLCMDPLVAGQSASIQLSHGTPNEDVVLMWSTALGSTVVNAGTWCVDFGITLPLGNPGAQLVSLSSFDGNGDYSLTRSIPSAAAGRTLYFQAAERNSCPDARMSNIVTQVVQ
ncbi:MAG: hypothetical protein COA70_10550 [Planctomycetota bacterium]|nr:MAG: hypothetical protein COA70_10550 [Planctomycetota bacterium]